MSGLLYSSFQKFYSALSALEQFDKEKDFFDNISSLDKFFSEFRAVTFVLQKAIAHTEYKEIYDKNRNIYLNDDSKWFVDKRNEVIKEHPFQLVKEIEITIYMPYGGFNVWRENFTVENDMDFSDVLDEIKELLVRSHENEVFFSASFNFYEKDTREDLYDKLIIGIKAMQEFLLAMRSDIGENSPLCEKIANKISEIRFFSSPKDFLFMIDYVFYPNTGGFERASRMEMMLGRNHKALRLPITTLNRLFSGDKLNSYFEKFIIMNVAIRTTDLMPTIWTVYEDNTFEIDVFNADLKTTIYRKINELASNIYRSEVSEVYCMMAYTLCDIDSITPHMTSKERINIGKEDCLAFFRVDKYLNEEECTFEGSKIEDVDYVSKRIFEERLNKLDIGRVNMIPVIEAFKQKAN